MTRGRKKDLTIPPTRALAQQRDYRARKARYVSDLEDRCHAAEEENARLRKELELARTGVATTSSLQMASSELLRHLSTASASLSHFHQLAFPHTVQTQFSIQPLTNLNTLRPASFPSPAPSPTGHSASSPTGVSLQPHSRKRTHSQSFTDEHGDTGSRHSSEPLGELPFSRRTMSRSPSLASECCGGFVDCTHCDDGHDELQDDEEQSGSASIRTSGMRYTSDDRTHTGEPKKA
jgi:hypothetical protein